MIIGAFFFYPHLSKTGGGRCGRRGKADAEVDREADGEGAREVGREGDRIR